MTDHRTLREAVEAVIAKYSVTFAHAKPVCGKFEDASIDDAPGYCLTCCQRNYLHDLREALLAAPAPSSPGSESAAKTGPATLVPSVPNGGDSGVSLAARKAPADAPSATPQCDAQTCECQCCPHDGGDCACACHGTHAEPPAPPAQVLTAEQDAILGGEEYRDILRRERDKARAEAQEALLETCLCAAVQFPDGYVVRGHRHHDCFRTAAGIPGRADGPFVQGFLTSRGRFVDRREGQRLQLAAGIPSADPGGYRADKLYSEDLY
jgi:hypothetical protein